MRNEARRSHLALVAWAVAVFTLSAISDLRLLLLSGLAALLLFRRGAARVAARVLAVVAPPALGLSLVSWGWLAVTGGNPPVAPYAALLARTLVIAFLSLSVLRRVDLLRAAAPFPTVSRLLVLCLAQIHALRRLATESALGLRSRLARRPWTRDVLRSSGAVTASLLALSVRNAREAGEAMRSRGFH